MHKNTYRIIAWGRYGDMVMSTALFKEIKEQQPGARIKLYLPRLISRQIFEHNPYIDSIHVIEDRFLFFFLLSKFRKTYHISSGQLIHSIFGDRTTVEIMGEIVGIRLKEKKANIFLTKKEDLDAKTFLAQYKNPICIQTATRGVNKFWFKHKWEDLIRQMQDYTFIQLGFSGEEEIEGAVNLLGKTSFRESMALLKHSLSFVGVDSALSHVTNAFDIPGVILFGSTTPKIWGHLNNINLYKSLRCSPCIDVLGYSDCPYNRRCMELITVADVKEALIKQLSFRKKL